MCPPTPLHSPLTSFVTHCSVSQIQEEAATLRQPLCTVNSFNVVHTFSVRTLIRWYRDGVDIDRHLPRLSTWLGHSCIADSYWYLTAVPELMALSARRLDERQGRHSS